MCEWHTSPLSLLPFCPFLCRHSVQAFLPFEVQISVALGANGRVSDSLVTGNKCEPSSCRLFTEPLSNTHSWDVMRRDKKINKKEKSAAGEGSGGRPRVSHSPHFIYAVVWTPRTRLRQKTAFFFFSPTTVDLQSAETVDTRVVMTICNWEALIHFRGKTHTSAFVEGVCYILHLSTTHKCVLVSVCVCVLNDRSYK